MSNDREQFYGSNFMYCNLHSLVTIHSRTVMLVSILYAVFQDSIKLINVTFVHTTLNVRTIVYF